MSLYLDKGFQFKFICIAQVATLVWKDPQCETPTEHVVETGLRRVTNR